MMLRKIVDTLRRSQTINRLGGGYGRVAPDRLLPNATGTRMYFHGFWPDAERDTRLIALLSDLLSDRATGYRRLCVASVFSPPPSERSPETLYVQFSGESRYHDPSLFDLNLIPAAPGPGIVTLPYMAFEYWKRPELMSLCRDRDITESEYIDRKPCLFVVSNAASKERIQFFDRFSKRIATDSWGAALNNQGGKRPSGQWWESEYLRLISQYRFMICFENRRADYYLTEKLLNAYAGGTIPIYWGCPQVDQWINPSAHMSIAGDYSAESADVLIERIRDCEMSYRNYREIFVEPLLRKCTAADKFDMRRVIDEINASG